jgi:hypothetical protein
MRSVSSFDSNAVEKPVSAARRDSVNRFWVRNARSFKPIQ